MTGSTVLTFFTTALWQGAFIAAICWITFKLVRIENASTRTTLWSLAFVVAAALPFSIFLPADDIAQVKTLMLTHPVVVSEVAVALSSTPHPETGVRGTPFFNAVATPLLIVFWIIGAAWRLFSLMRDAINVSKMRLESTAIKNRAAFADGNKIELRTHPSIKNPAATGFFRPVILAPNSFAKDPNTPAHHSILAHEIAHIRRGDLFANFFESVVLAIFWWNPSLHLIRAEITDNREMACDDEAVMKTTYAKDYALVLVEYAEEVLKMRAIKTNSKQQAMLALTGRPSGFSKRIKRLAARNYSPATGLKPIRLCLAVAAISAATSYSTIAAPRVAFAGQAEIASGNGQADTGSKAQALGRTLVHAVLDNDMAQARHLLASGADINAVLEGDGTPLIAAVNEDSFEFANWLIENGADVDAYAIYDETALISAVRSDSIDMVRLLIAAGAKPNLSAETENGELRSPLSEARRNKYRDIEMELIAVGAVQ